MTAGTPLSVDAEEDAAAKRSLHNLRETRDALRAMQAIVADAAQPGITARNTQLLVGLLEVAWGLTDQMADDIDTELLARKAS
jgi:hypothetical protein